MYITHDGRKASVSNLSIWSDNGITILMSYATPVAFRDDRDVAKCNKWFFTSHKYSPTTSKQITCFLNSENTSRAESVETGQHAIDNAYANMMYDDNNCLHSEYSHNN